jgi:micrococcal nuclease
MGSVWTRIALRSKTSENTPDYGFAGQVMWGKVVSVYDGDTLKAVVCINGLYQQVKIRCYGYDSPEMKPPLSKENREIEIERAIKARDFLSGLVLNKIVRIHFYEFDKYGRFLGTIYLRKCCSDIDINKLMIEKGYGYEYFGGTKKSSI